MTYRTRITTLCIAIFLSLPLAAIAAELTIPNSFSNGAAADADQVNANFSAVKEAVDDNNQKILILSEPRSVTYSAMGFSPGAAVATMSEVTGYVTAFETEFRKNPADGSLALIDEGNRTFYHSLPLPSGVIITRISAYVSGAAKANLKKAGEAEPLAGVTGTEGEPHTVESDSLQQTIEGFPASYFIEVTLGNKAQRLYSVAIEYAYPAP